MEDITRRMRMEQLSLFDYRNEDYKNGLSIALSKKDEEELKRKMAFAVLEVYKKGEEDNESDTKA